MPELSKPLIAVIGVLVSIAILFIAVLGILPFLQGTVGSVSQQAQFSMVASAATVGSGTTINKVIFTVTVQKLAGTGTYQILDEANITIIDPTGNSTSANVSGISVSPAMPQSFSTSLTFTIEVDSTSGLSLQKGNWGLVVLISDSGNNPVQSVSVTVPVA